MDWTGGTRRRYAGARQNNAALQRQKAHFARARAGRGGTKQGLATNHRQRPPSTTGKSLISAANSIIALPRPSRPSRPPFIIPGGHRAQSFARNDGTVVIFRNGVDQDVISVSECNSANERHEQSQARASVDDREIFDDQELMMLALRRKLLLRDDWLALRPTRPLRLGFPATASNEQVGRRKKIKKPTKDARPARQRSLTPSFERRLHTNRYFMSGALPTAQEEYIEVKVGSSAFGSRGFSSSQKSNATVRTNAAPISRSFSHLSEEPMLLGADGDTFDADQVEVPAVKQFIPPAYCVNRHALMVTDDDPVEVLDEGEYDSDARSSAQLRSSHDCTNTLDLWATAVAPDSAELRNESDSNVRLQAASAHPAVFHFNQEPQLVDNRSNGIVKGALVPGVEHGVAKIATESASLGDEEITWRRIMGIPMQTPSSISNKAVKSFSRDQCIAQIDSPAKLDGQQYQEQAKGISAHPALSDHDLPTTWQGQIHPRQVTDDAVDCESLWRAFIIGSQYGVSEDGLHLDSQCERIKWRSDSDQPLSFDMSGLGTSDKATQGVTTGSTASSISQVRDSPESEYDDIECFYTEVSPKEAGQRNIQAASNRSRNLKRFKRAPAMDQAGSRKSRQGYKVLRQSKW